MSDTFTNFIKRDYFAALREENERLKAENRELNLDVKMYQEYYVHQNKLFDAQDEIKILKIAKRELVEVIEKTLQIITDTLIYYAVFNYPEQPEIVLGEVLKAAVAKHKKE